MAASYRPLAFEPQSAQDTVQDGDSPIRSVVSTQLSGDSRQLGRSQLVLTQYMISLGVLLDSVNFRASPAQKRVD